MKSLLIALLAVTILAKGPGLRFGHSSESTILDDFLTGLLFGVGDYGFYSDLLDCAGSNWANDLAMIRTYFQSLDESSQTNVENRLSTVAETWSYLGAKYSACATMYPTLTSVFNAIVSFDVDTGVVHFQQEGTTFHNYLQTATTNYDRSSFMTFGMYVGMFYKKLLTTV